MADATPHGLLFVCRTARGQHKRGGNVAVAWGEPDSTTPNRDEAYDDSRGQERAAGTGGTDAALPPTTTHEED